MILKELILYLLLIILSVNAQKFKCYCNQFNTVGCVRKNSTWGECSATAGKQLCIATWERSPIDSLIIVEYFCSDAALLRYSCLPNGVQMLGSEQFPIVKVCCESDYCNGPTRLQSFVDTLVTDSTMGGTVPPPLANLSHDFPVATYTQEGTEPTAPPTTNMSLITPNVTVENLTCYCNQLSTPGCVEVNTTWGECNVTRGAGVCLASYELLQGTSEPYTQYSCSTDEILILGCLPIQRSGGTQFAVTTACCEDDYCNTPHLLSFLNSTTHPENISGSPVPSETPFLN